MKLNPVLQKEFTMSSRSIRVPVTIFIFNMILAVFGFTIFYSIIDTAKYSGVVNYSSMINLYYVMATIEFCMIVLIVPAITASSISGERERQTLDVLLTTRMTPWRIIWGKLIASIITVIMLIMSSFPVLALIFAFGGASISQLLLLSLILVVSAVFIGSISIMYSAVLKRTSSATVASYGTVIAVYIGTVLVVYGTYLYFSNRFMIQAEYDAVADLSILSNLLLVNPAVTFFTWISDIAHSDVTMTNFITMLGGDPDSFILKNWIIISLVVQSLISAAALRRAVVSLRPKKRKRKKY